MTRHFEACKRKSQEESFTKRAIQISKNVSFAKLRNLHYIFHSNSVYETVPS